MASLVLYGSAIADTTLTAACKMSAASGGTETSKRTTFDTAGNLFAEIFSQGGVSTTYTAAQNPTGHGWVFQPGAGTFSAANWSGSVAFSINFSGTLGGSITLRFYTYSSGVYTSIGTISLANPVVSTSRTVFSFPATAMPAVTTGASDLTYVDFWWNSTSGFTGGFVDIYESTSATAGVTNDMQITTSNFTASGGATHFSIFDGYSGFVS